MRTGIRGSAILGALAPTAFLLAALAACTPASSDDGPAAASPEVTASASVPAISVAPAPASSTPSPTATPSPSGAASGSASALLATLAVQGRAPSTGYDRDEYGQAWADVDRNGCDTRNDILGRDLTDKTFQPGTRDCVVLSGDAASDFYTAGAIRFVRGGASEIDIDHVVALADSWQKGAGRWDVRKRIAFANDPLNLLAVDASANRQKGAADAATWLPANKGFRCAYVARQVAVKAKYALWVTASERDAIGRVLHRCPGQDAPTGDAPVLAPAGLGVVEPVPERTQTPKEPTTEASDPRFPYCKDAVPAGYGPYVSGTDPEYGWYTDADHDGVVCER